MRKLVKYMRSRKFRKLDFAAILLLAAGLVFLNTFFYKADGLFEGKISLTDVYMAWQDAYGNTYAIDDGHTRVIKLDKNNRAAFSVRGNGRNEDTITYASDLAIGKNGDIFVEENHWDGMYVDREAILVYDADGNYKATCYDVSYADEYENKRRIFGMTVYDGWLYFGQLQAEAIEICRVHEETYNFEIIETVDYGNAFNAVYDINIVPETGQMYVLDKRNQILCFDKDGRKVLYDSAKDKTAAGKSAFYAIAADGADNLYISDIKGNKIFFLPSGADTLETVISDGLALTVRGQTDLDGNFCVLAVYDGEIYKIDDDHQITALGNTFERTAAFSRFMTVVYAVMAFCAIAGIWIGIRVTAVLLNIRFSQVVRSGILISGVVAFVVVVISTQLFSSFRKVYTEELLDKLSISAHAVSAQLNETVLKAVDRPEDFMGGAYNELMEVMYRTLDREYEFNRNIYCNLLKYKDGEGFSVAYMDQSAGAYYPLDEVETKEVEYIYNTGLDVRNDGKADVAGSFVYVKVPVFNDHKEVVGVVAVGSDSTIISQQIETMQVGILITLVTMILVLLFLFGEVLGFFDLRSKYKAVAEEERKGIVPLHMVRLIIFVTFFAFNMATSFLPVYAAQLAGEAIGIPKALSASLPLTLNLAFMGIMSLLCAPLMARFSFKNIAVVSAAICFVGDISIFLNTGYYTLLGGLILNGIGVGLITNCINMFIASSKDMALKRDGFTIFNSGSVSGINIGSMFGASLAGQLGQQQVFAVSSTAWILVAILFLVFGKYLSGKNETDKKENAGRSIRGFGQFIVSPKVWGYMLCIQVPYIMFNSFIFYYVPLYSAGQGLSENVTCLLLMLYSLCSVFFGVALTDFFMNRFRQMTIYISTAMSLAGLLLFAAKPSVKMLIVTLLVMGVSSSFGVSSRSVYFTELPQVQVYGEEQSMGIYNLTDNVGESAGPVIFGSLMASGNLLTAMGRFVLIISGAAAAYAFGGRLKGRKGGVLKDD